MPVMAMAAKDQAKARAGRLGALARWGEPRIVRLDDLTPEQARLVRALVDAAKSSPSAHEVADNEMAVAVGQKPATAGGDDRASGRNPA
jgi:hypothetical protein